ALRQLRLVLEYLGQHRYPGAELRLRLNRPLVGELGRARPQHLANGVACNPQLARNALDPLAVLKVLEPDPRDRLHARHPPTSPGPQERSSAKLQRGGSDWTRKPRLRG